MPTKFLTNTPLACFEREMQQVPGFRPRTSGTVTNHFTYTASDCDCQNCLHWTTHKKCGSVDGCVCLCERLEAGCMPLSELLEELAIHLPTHPFVSRMTHLSQQIQQSDTLFLDEDHIDRFEAACQMKLTKTTAKMAAVFLLTAHTFLWEKTQTAITAERINFHSIYLQGIDLDGYALFQTAKDLYYGTKHHISLAELTDPEIISDEGFRLIITAFLVCRYGAEILCVEGSGE